MIYSSAGRCLGRQVGKKFRAGQLAEDQLEMLAEIPGMPLKMERWKRLSMKAAMTWSDGCMALADWLRSHGNRGLSYKGPLGWSCVWDSVGVHCQCVACEVDASLEIDCIM